MQSSQTLLQTVSTTWKAKHKIQNPHSKIAKILKIDPLVRNIPEIEIQCCKMKESRKLSTQICILLPKNVFKQAVSHIHDLPSRSCVLWIHQDNLRRWCYLWDLHKQRTINGMITFHKIFFKASLHVTAVSWPQKKKMKMCFLQYSHAEWNLVY